MGDVGQSNHAHLTLESLFHSKHEIDAAVLAGDIAYTRKDHRKWDTFFDFLDDYAAFDAIPVRLVLHIVYPVEKLHDS